MVGLGHYWWFCIERTLEAVADVHQVPSWELRGSLVTGSCGLTLGPCGESVVMKRPYFQFKNETTATEKTREKTLQKITTGE